MEASCESPRSKAGSSSCERAPAVATNFTPGAASCPPYPPEQKHRLRRKKSALTCIAFLSVDYNEHGTFSKPNEQNQACLSYAMARK